MGGIGGVAEQVLQRGHAQAGGRLSPEEIRHRFRYHSPDAAKIEMHEAIRDLITVVVVEVADQLPPCRERSTIHHPDAAGSDAWLTLRLRSIPWVPPVPAATDNALNIARNVAGMVGLTGLTTLRSSGENRAAQAMLPLMNRGGRILGSRRGSFSQGWPEMVKEHTFTTTAGLESYPFPDDYVEIVNMSVWDRTTFRDAQGPISPQEWQAFKSGLIDRIALTPAYRIKLDPDTNTVRFFLDPVPDSDSEELVFEYISRNWVREGPSGPVEQGRHHERLRRADLPVPPGGDGS